MRMQGCTLEIGGNSDLNVQLNLENCICIQTILMSDICLPRSWSSAVVVVSLFFCYVYLALIIDITRTDAAGWTLAGTSSAALLLRAMTISFKALTAGRNVSKR